MKEIIERPEIYTVISNGEPANGNALPRSARIDGYIIYLLDGIAIAVSQIPIGATARFLHEYKGDYYYEVMLPQNYAELQAAKDLQLQKEVEAVKKFAELLQKEKNKIVGAKYNYEFTEGFPAIAIIQYSIDGISMVAKAALNYTLKRGSFRDEDGELHLLDYSPADWSKYNGATIDIER